MSALVLFKLRGSARTKTKGSPVHPRSSFSSVAATSLPPLLLCCCCCAAASAVPRSAMHRGARSAMLIRTQCMLVICRVPKKSPASVFHFLHLAFWFDPGCWDQNSNSTSPPPPLLRCCCCAAAAVLLKNIALPLQAFQHVKCLRVTRSQHVKYLRVTRS